ncbi:MAG TPA: signal peptidase II [Gemmatimonadaceae bacterium]|nr:signal peptidase II [Gemmatimonadaceae bacterium]
MVDKSGNRLFFTTASIVILLDQVTKQWAVQNLQPPHIPHEIWGSFLRFTLAFNKGAAFSMSLGEYSRYIFGAFAIIALVILWRLFRASRPGDTVRVLALALAFGGAAGNLIDRFRARASVVDFIDIGVGNVRFWTFNIADTAVTFGAIMLAFVLWKEDAALEAEPEPAPPPVTVDGEAA